MTIYEFGETVLVPFPFTDQTSAKKRPVVIVSSAQYNQQHLDLILIAVTSQISATIRLGEMEISDWASAGLLKASMIKPILTTIEKNLVIRKLGTLQQADCETLRHLLVTDILG